VHARLLAFAFPDRPAEWAGDAEVSRFSCMLFLNVFGIFDYGGFVASSRFPAATMWPSLWTYKVGIPN
jgi:hypothetical protein